MADKADRKRPSVGVIAQVTSPGLRLTAAPIGDALAEKKPRPSPSAADRDEYEGSLDGPDVRVLLLQDALLIQTSVSSSSLRAMHPKSTFTKKTRVAP